MRLSHALSECARCLRRRRSAVAGNRARPFQGLQPRRPQLIRHPEHDAEKCERFSGDIMLQLFNLEQDDFRPNGPKIILF
ncbi:hypothetical protein CO657_28050 (plasmid) [Rhizobium acidisoli]|uniref:Uncharacterized protein n=1 Tax=Rhizobium acidisoli TaxID=1538158 RepID=A0AAE6C4K7_9HYPH|nr:hypothetical protein CO657_28050 [Rhizobium acidisoli]